MAKASEKVIETLRRAMALLSASENYQWGHMGCCNCGFLAQAITHRSGRDIHAAAMTGHGDWSEQLNDYCPTSGFPMDELIATLLEAGFEREDLVMLERLSDPVVLARIPEERNLRHNLKRDVLTYFRAWLSLVEEQWVAQQPAVIIPGTILNREAEHKTILDGVVLVDKPEPFLPTLHTVEA